MKTNLKVLRKKAGYQTAESFAEEHGYSVHTYRKYEQGVIDMPLDVACDLADVLKCTLDELAGRDASPSGLSSSELDLVGAYRNMDGRARRDLLTIANSLSPSVGDSIEKSA